MSVTTTSNLSPFVQAYYDKRLLLMAKPLMVAEQFAQKRTLEQGKGKTIYFTRYQPLPKNKTPLQESATGGITNKALQQQEISANINWYGDVVEISEIASLTALDKGVKEKVDIVANACGETINSLINDEIGTGFIRRRADADGTYQKDVVSTAAGTKTTIISSSLTESNDHWNGGYVTFTDPTKPNYGITVKVTDFDASTDTLTVDALPVAVPSGASFRVVVGTGIAATDVLSSTAIKLARRDLKRAKAMPFEDGKYVCIVDPDTEYDFMNDSEWKDVKKYQDKKDIYEGELGEWYGIRFVSATEVYRESVAGVASETGAVHVITLLGREAFGVVDLDGVKRKIIVKNPQDLAQPLEMTGTVGYKVPFVAKTLNGVFGVNILCGATA